MSFIVANLVFILYFVDAMRTSYHISSPKAFLGKGDLKICSKCTGKYPCRSATSIKLPCNFIEITLWHGFSSVNLLPIFRKLFPKNNSRVLLLKREKHGSINIAKCFLCQKENQFAKQIHGFSFKSWFQIILFNLHHSVYIIQLRRDYKIQFGFGHIY